MFSDIFLSLSLIGFFELEYFSFLVITYFENIVKSYILFCIELPVLSRIYQLDIRIPRIMYRSIST